MEQLVEVQKPNTKKTNHKSKQTPSIDPCYNKLWVTGCNQSFSVTVTYVHLFIFTCLDYGSSTKDVHKMLHTLIHSNAT